MPSVSPSFIRPPRIGQQHLSIAIPITLIRTSTPSRCASRIFYSPTHMYLKTFERKYFRVVIGYESMHLQILLECVQGRPAYCPRIGYTPASGTPVLWILNLPAPFFHPLHAPTTPARALIRRHRHKETRMFNIFCSMREVIVWNTTRL